MKTQINVMSPLRVSQAPIRAIASKLALPQNGLQPDLLYMDSVLVSTGQNKNDDVFLPDEMWRARSSPILKPVDWEHNTGKELLGQPGVDLVDERRIIEDSQIIGVMYNSFAATKNGTIISDEQVLADEFVIPEEFDIINQAVIYKYLYPKAAARIVRDANSGALFVSMEAWFTDYDYRVGNKIVARNEETAFLDNHLRANGGNGIFGHVNVGRVLRNIVFGGVGIVAKPANEDSVIHSFTNASLQKTEIVNSAVASNIIGEIPGAKASTESQEVIEIMSDTKTNVAPAVANISQDDYKDVVQRLVKAEHTIEQRDAAVASAEAETETLRANVENLTSAFVNGSETLADVLGAEAARKLQQADAADFFGVLAEAVGEKLEASKKLEEQLVEANHKVAELEAEKRSVARQAQIDEVLSIATNMEKDKKEERKKKMAEATKNLDDDAFAAYLEDAKELITLAAAPPFKKKDEDEDEKKKDDAKASDDGITDPAILDNVKATASVSAGNEVVPADNGSDKWMSLANDLLGATKRD